MPYRILHIIDTLARTGAGTQLSLLVRGLPRSEFEMHVCSLTRGGALANELRAAGCQVYEAGRRWPLDPPAFLRLRAMIRQWPPQLIHTWDERSRQYGGLAVRACRVEHWVREAREPMESGTWLDGSLDRYLSGALSAIVTPTPHIREQLVRRGVDSSRIPIIPRGTPVALPPQVTREQILAEFGLPSDARLTAAIGRLEPHKRLKDVIWATDLLKVIRSDVHCLIIGVGSHLARLTRFREQVCIEDKVHFLGERHDVPQILPHLEWLYQAGERDGCSQSILEALAAGVPVIATNLPSHRELITDGEHGYLVPVGDRAALARAGNRLLNDAQLAKQLEDAACVRASTQFCVQTMLERYHALYRGVLDY